MPSLSLTSTLQDHSCQVVSAEATRDAVTLLEMAKAVYQPLSSSVSKLPGVAGFDNGDIQGMLRVQVGSRGLHVDRGVFNLVSGDAAALSQLRIAGVSASRFPLGAVLAIRGKTLDILQKADKAPQHEVSLLPGQKLIVLAVRIGCDIPLGRGSSLATLLEQLFGDSKQVEPIPFEERADVDEGDTGESICVKKLTGEVFLVNNWAAMTIFQLKQHLEKTEGIPTDQHKLILHGRILDRDEWLLTDYGIRAGSIVHLLPNLRGD